METFLIIIGCIFLYIFGTFITFVLYLYCDRCEFEPSIAYDDDNNMNHLGISLVWPISIWFPLTYLLFLKLKEYAITITEILYQINHKEDKDDEEK